MVLMFLNFSFHFFLVKILVIKNLVFGHFRDKNSSLSCVLTSYLFLFSKAEKALSFPFHFFTSCQSALPPLLSITELIFPSPPSLFQLASSCLFLIGCFKLSIGFPSVLLSTTSHFASHQHQLWLAEPTASPPSAALV